MLWCISVVLMRKKAAPHSNRIHFVLFVCVLCTMWCFVWFLHEMVLLLHENLNYCTKHIWCLCKLQYKNFSMVCCTTLWWDGAWKGRGWKTAAIIYCWQQQRVRGRTAQLSDISSGATCVADLDSRALALTKEASGNSRALTQRVGHKGYRTIKQNVHQVMSHCSWCMKLYHIWMKWWKTKFQGTEKGEIRSAEFLRL